MWYSPFWVTNLVGVALSYRVERSGGDAIGEWQRLDPHESAPVSIAEMSLLDMDQFALSRLVLVVLLDLPAANQQIRADTSLYVPLHRVRKYEYHYVKFFLSCPYFIDFLDTKCKSAARKNNPA